MSEADKMFKELGYTKKENDKGIKYVYDHEIMGEHFLYDITFWKTSEMMFLNVITGLNKDDLKAVCKKCEELGWI